jgi:hypothetical protein
MARPRARTQTGRNICNSAARRRGRRHPGEPGEHQGHKGGRKAGGQHDHGRSGRVEKAGGAEHPVVGQPVPHPSQRHRADNGAEAEGAEQSSEAVRREAQPSAGDQRQQRPQRHGRHDEHDGAEQDAAHDGFVPDVAASGAQGWQETLPAGCRCRLRLAREEQNEREKDSGCGFEGEGDRYATEVGDRQPGQHRSDRIGQVDADQVQPGRRPQLRAWHQLGHHGLPCRDLHRRADTQGESESQQQRRRHQPGSGEHPQQQGDDEEIALHRDQQPAPIEGIGQDATG